MRERRIWCTITQGMRCEMAGMQLRFSARHRSSSGTDSVDLADVRVSGGSRGWKISDQQKARAEKVVFIVGYKFGQKVKMQKQGVLLLG